MIWKTFLELHSNIAPYEEIAYVLWTRTDVYEKVCEVYPDLVITDEIVDEVLHRMDHHADCENGMTWETLEFHLEEVLREKELIS